MTYTEVTYEVSASAAHVDSIADALLLEQTFETPYSVVQRHTEVLDRGQGQIASIQEVGNDRFQIRLLLPDLHIFGPGDVMNGIFGNAAIHSYVRLVDFLPSAVTAKRLPGPNLGIEGIRDQLDIPTRPLTATALKPVGLPLPALVELCEEFAAGGIDVIKDDHYLSEQPQCTFEDRLLRCMHVVKDAGAKQGRVIWYVPNITGTPSEVRRKLDLALEAGVECVMLAPMTIGLPTLAEIAAYYPELAILTHPSGSPMASFSPEALWGKLFRLFGGDAVIFVSYGGRFDYSLETTRLVAANMRAPIYDLRQALPVPAGGVSVDRVEEVIRAYGNDCMLLVGGSILQERNRADATRRLVESVLEHTLLVN